MIRNLPERINDCLPDSLKVGAGTLYVRTERGKDAIDTIADRDWWDTWHTAGIGAFVLAMASILLALASTAVRNITRDVQPTAANQPSNLIALPGVNDFIPVEATVYLFVALALAATVHELAHAVAMRRADVEIREMGAILLLGVLPLGAYVLPDEELDETTAAFDRLRIYSAGVMANLAVVALASVPFVLGVVDPLVQAWGVYFGGITSGMERVAFGSVGAATHLVFWLWFLNLNLGLVNAIPVIGMDGGQVAGVVSERWFADERRVVVGVTVVSVAVFAAAIFGPHFF